MPDFSRRLIHSDVTIVSGGTTNNIVRASFETEKVANFLSQDLEYVKIGIIRTNSGGIAQANFLLIPMMATIPGFTFVGDLPCPDDCIPELFQAIIEYPIFHHFDKADVEAIVEFCESAGHPYIDVALAKISGSANPNSFAMYGNTGTELRNDASDIAFVSRSNT